MISGRLTRDEVDEDFSNELIQRIRKHFHKNLAKPNASYSSPDYKEVRDLERFISLPEEPALRKGEKYRPPRPGLHGTLRLATSKYIQDELKIIEAERRKKW